MTGYDLSSLRITLLAAREPPEARFELRAAGADRNSTCADLTANLADLGFTDLGPCAAPPDSYTVPAPLLDRLAAEVGKLDPKRPLWLDLVHPAGVLAMVPWERLFQPRFDLPLLRMPTIFIESAHSRTCLDVALVANDPSETPKRMADLVYQLAERIVLDTPLSVSVHIFTDAATFCALPKTGWPGGHRGKVILYDPVEGVTRPDSGSANRLEAPESSWLQWVRRAAVQSRIDVVHLITHGRLLNGGGALALSASPVDDQRGSRVALLNAEELDSFMTRTGAWSLVLSSAPSRDSGSAQRHFADTMAVLRPGSVLWHDLPSDRDSRMLGKAYRFLFNEMPSEPPSTACLAICCQPWHVAAEVGAGPAGRWHLAAREEEPISDAVRARLEEMPGTPLWITATQRFVERTEWNLLQQEQQNLPTPEASEVRAALAALREVVDQYTAAEVPQPPAPNDLTASAGLEQHFGQ